jgi:hypothetical protein
MKYWEVIADQLSEAGWTWGYCSHTTDAGEVAFCVDASRDGKRYIVRANQLLAAFLELLAQLAVVHPHTEDFRRSV